jgi:2-haloacid dehalogenase
LSLDKLGGKHRIALVSNIDDDLLQATPVPGGIDLVCTAERARGYKPDGTLFRYLIANAGVAIPEILHSGQSQHTDMVGGKPLGLTVTWINRRNEGVGMDETELEKLARLSGKAASKTLGALEPRGRRR